MCYSPVHMMRSLCFGNTHGYPSCALIHQHVIDMIPGFMNEEISRVKSFRPCLFFLKNTSLLSRNMFSNLLTLATISWMFTLVESMMTPPRKSLNIPLNWSLHLLDSPCKNTSNPGFELSIFQEEMKL